MNNTSIQNSNNDEQEHIDQFRHALDILNQEYEYQKNTYAKEFNQMKEIINTKNSKIEEYKSKYDIIINENKKLKSIIITLKNRIKSLEQQLENLKNNQNNLILKQTEIRNHFDIDVSKAINNIDYLVKKEMPKSTIATFNLEPIRKFDFDKIKERIENDNKNNIFLRENNFDNLQSQKERNEFFNKCKKKMNPLDYANLISVVKLSNSNSISKNETYIRITNILDNKYPQISNLFKKLFSPIK